jgi:hypothetical protein
MAGAVPRRTAAAFKRLTGMAKETAFAGRGFQPEELSGGVLHA